MKILMVCLGNICRSPLAEGILRHKISQRSLDWIVDSAGTGSWHIGDPPHQGSIKVAKKHGMNIADLRGRQFKKEDFKLFDKIYVMDADNYNEVKRMAEENFDENKIDLILNLVHPGKNQPVPDPWYANTDAAFENVFQLLDIATDKIIKEYAK